MNIVAPKRVYRQSARARTAEATGERILDVFTACLSEHWFDEIRLDDVAREAGVTIQTVIRRFGSKEGLLNAVHERIGAEIRQRREVEPGDASGAVAALIKDYEEVGDLVLRSLAQEERYPAIRQMTDVGRAMHRQWMSTAFEPWLDAMSADGRRRAIDGLVVAGDIYVWKLIRRDLGRSAEEYRDLVEGMCAAAIGAQRDKVFNASASGDSQ